MNPLGLFLEPPGPLLTHLHNFYMAYSERLPTRLNTLAERICFSQVSLRVYADPVDPRGEHRVISDCHFAVQLNHFIPGFLPYSVAVFLK